MYIHVYIHIYIQMSIQIWHMYMYIYIHLQRQTSVCIFIYIYICTDTDILTYRYHILYNVYVYVYIYINMCVYICNKMGETSILWEQNGCSKPLTCQGILFQTPAMATRRQPVPNLWGKWLGCCHFRWICLQFGYPTSLLSTHFPNTKMPLGWPPSIFFHTKNF